MAGVRDPAFWKRFSMAVHLDDEENASGRPELKHKYVSYTPTPANTLSPSPQISL